jgi:hypothetical protein
MRNYSRPTEGRPTGPADAKAAGLKSTDVIDVLSDLFSKRGVPGYIRSDTGPEFIAQAVRE